MCRQENSAHSMNYEWINYHVYDKELLSLIALHPLLDTVVMSRLGEDHTQFKFLDFTCKYVKSLLCMRDLSHMKHPVSNPKHQRLFASLIIQH